MFFGPDRLPEMNTLTRQRRLILAVAAGSILVIVLFSFAFFNCDVHVDESWLGQQVYSLVTRGEVYSEFFRDAPPLDGRIVLYHTAFIRTGAVLATFLGWGLYQLRTLSLLCGLLVIILVVCRRAEYSPPATRWLVVFPLLFSPLFSHQMIIFRPEMMVTAFGFAGFVLLEFGLKSNRGWIVALAGASSGLAGCTHAVGLVFAVAGLVVLIAHRRVLHAGIFAGFAAVAFAPYLFGWFTDRALFLQQALHNPLIQSDLNFPWYQPFLNIVDEHKRWFRNFESIGISGLFVLALLQTSRAEFKKQKTLWTYLATVALLLAAIPMPKMSRYLMSLLPFFALVIADRWAQPAQPRLGFSRLLHIAFVGWTLIFVGCGIGYLVRQAFFEPHDRIATNRRLAADVPDGSLVMAPFDFVFEEQAHLTIQSFRGARFKGQPNLTPRFLESYADSLGVDYIIFSPEELGDWNLPAVDPAVNLTLYEKTVYLPDQERWMVHRLPRPAETGLPAVR